MTIRKDQARLTTDEKRRFVNAVLALKRIGQYDVFVATHNAFIMSDTDQGERVGHRSPSFLPWHRRFLIQFGQALQSVDSSVALPYWDWTTDRTAASSLWAPDFLGGTGRARDGQVIDGPFAAASGSWPLNVRVDGRNFLRRALGSGGLPLPTRAEVGPFDIRLRRTAVEQCLGRFAQQPRRVARPQPAQPRPCLGRRPHGNRCLSERPRVLATPRLHRQTLVSMAATSPQLPIPPGDRHTERRRPARDDAPMERRHTSRHVGPHAVLRLRHLDVGGTDELSQVAPPKPFPTPPHRGLRRAEMCPLGLECDLGAVGQYTAATACAFDFSDPVTACLRSRNEAS
jgi:hypothetical protein